MLERFRFWVANAICPPISVMVRVSRRVHVQKNVRIGPMVRVVVPKASPSSANEQVQADLPLEHEGLTEYQQQRYVDMAGGDAKSRDAVFARANALRGVRLVPPDVIARLRGQLIEEGKLPKDPDE